MREQILQRINKVQNVSSFHRNIALFRMCSLQNVPAIRLQGQDNHPDTRGQRTHFTESEHILYSEDTFCTPAIHPQGQDNHPDTLPNTSAQSYLYMCAYMYVYM